MKSRFLFLFPLLLFSLPLFAQQPTPAELEASLYFQEACNLSSEMGERIWPGFRLKEIPFAFYTYKGRAIIFNHPSPPGDAKRASLPEEIVESAVFTNDTGQMNANTSIQYHGKGTSIVSLSTLSSYKASPFAVGLIVHEAFHSFQDLTEIKGGRPWPREISAKVSDYPANSALNNALGNLEGVTLFQALKEKDEDEARDLIRKFLTLRFFRRTFLSEDLVQFEDGLETNEGLAEYAGMKAILEGRGGPYKPGAFFARRSIAYPAWPAFLEKRMKVLTSINKKGEGSARRRFYQTGLAQALLLDRFQHGWKKTFMKSFLPLSTMLAEALRWEDRNTLDRVKEILAQFSFHQIYDEEKAFARKKYEEDIELLRQALFANEHLVLVDLSPPAQDAGRMEFDPMNIRGIPGGAKVHTRMLRVMGGGGLNMEFDQPVAQFEKRKIYASALSEEVTFRIDGAQVTYPLVNDKIGFNSFKLESPSVRISGRRGVFAQKGKVLVIRFGKSVDLDWGKYSDFLGGDKGDPVRDEIPASVVKNLLKK